MRNPPNENDRTEALRRILGCWNAFLTGLKVHPGSTAEAEIREMDMAIERAAEINLDLLSALSQSERIAAQAPGSKQDGGADERAIGATPAAAIARSSTRAKDAPCFVPGCEHPRGPCRLPQAVYCGCVAARITPSAIAFAIPTKLTPTELQGKVARGYTEGWNACIDAMLRSTDSRRA